MQNPRLVITLDTATGRVSIDGPIQDRLFCFGLLELAKDAINAHAREQAANVLLASMPNIPNLRQIKP